MRVTFPFVIAREPRNLRSAPVLIALKGCVIHSISGICDNVIKTKILFCHAHHAVSLRTTTRSVLRGGK